MTYEIVELNPEHLDKLLKGDDPSRLVAESVKAYFSLGSSSYCLLANGEPVFAGGVVNMQWSRGEAWMLPTPFFRRHVKTCFKAMKQYLPHLAEGFVRVQATCYRGVSTKILTRLGFKYEGTMQKFGPNGEVCNLYARIFDKKVVQ